MIDPNQQMVSAVQGKQQGPIPTLRPTPQQNPIELMKRQALMAQLLKQSQAPYSITQPKMPEPPTPFGLGKITHDDTEASPTTNLFSNLKLAYGNNPSASTGTTQSTIPYVRGSPLTDENWGAYANRTASVESENNPFLGANKQGNRGLMQWSSDLEHKYGLNQNNWTDVNAQHAALRQEYNEALPKLTQALGRPPTPGEAYLGWHQQGSGGGPALLRAAQTSPNTPAWQVLMPHYDNNERVARSAVTNNPYTKGMDPEVPTGDFVNGWVNKFEQGMQ